MQWRAVTHVPRVLDGCDGACFLPLCVGYTRTRSRRDPAKRDFICFVFPGLRKLDAQSLNDLARQHHEEDARRERRRAPSVPSPDSLSMDDTPGPSDEERESARSFRRPAFHTERLKLCFNIVGTSSTIKVSSISIG